MTVKYDSKFEKMLAEGVLQACAYHPDRMEYTINRAAKYQPDFEHTKDGITYVIEAKGRFRTHEEARKYLFIREELIRKGKREGKQYELVFVFMNTRTPYVGARKRKDGTKRTIADWADKHGFLYFDSVSIGEIL